MQRTYIKPVYHDGFTIKLIHSGYRANISQTSFTISKGQYVSAKTSSHDRKARGAGYWICDWTSADTAPGFLAIAKQHLHSVKVFSFSPAPFPLCAGWG